MAKELFMLVGLPRSGKTTWRKKFISDFGGDKPVVVSADDIRYLVYGQRFFSSGEPIVWALRGLMLRYLMQQGKPIVIDETNTIKRNREAIIKIAKEFGYTIEAVVLPTTREECIDRAKALNDEYILPIIDRMAEQYEPISTDEGIDTVYVVGDYNVL